VVIYEDLINLRTDIPRKWANWR